MTRFYVIDPSITHGVVMEVHQEGETPPSFNMVYSWDNNCGYYGLKQPIKSHFNLARQIISKKTADDTPIWIYIDYDVNTAMFAQQRKLAQYMAYFIGCLSTMIAEQWYSSFVYLNPSDIRKWLGVKQRATKIAVWSEYVNRYTWNLDYSVPKSEKEWRKLERNNLMSDTLDCEIMGRYVLEVVVNAKQ